MGHAENRKSHRIAGRRNVCATGAKVKGRRVAERRDVCATRAKVKGRRVAGRRDVCATGAPQGKAGSKTDTFVTAAFGCVAQSLRVQKTLRLFGPEYAVARGKHAAIIATCRASAE